MRGISKRIVIHSIAVGILLTLSSFLNSPASVSDGVSNPVAYSEILSEGLSSKALLEAIDGYSHMKEKEGISKDILVVIDYTRSSNLERFFILNMNDTSLTHSLLVAHGRNSGDEFATSFSNVTGSFQSSIGFFRTAETYNGKHGLSLRLDGLEVGINNNARSRALVIHQADYVSPDFALEFGRIGRSLGCPALPMEGYEEVIETIKEGCLIYIYGGSDAYAMNSSFLSES